MMTGYICFADSSKMPVVNEAISMANFKINRVFDFLLQNTLLQFGGFYNLKGSTKSRFVLSIIKPMKKQ
jgi:hypothetical protein